MQIIEHAPPPSPLPVGQPIDILSHPTRDDRRVDLEGQVTLRYPDLEGPVTERTQNVSATGMFIRTRSLRPLGTTCQFELDLANGLESVQGEAEVVWVRRQDDGLFRPVGMGVRFVDLDSESRQLMRWSVEHRTRELRKFLHLDAVEAPPAAFGRGPMEQSNRTDLADLRMELENALDGATEPSVLAELRAEVDVVLTDILEGSCSRGAEQSLANHPYAGCASATGPAISTGRRARRILSAIPLLPVAVLCLYLLSPAPEPVEATPSTEIAPALESSAGAGLVLEPIDTLGEAPLTLEQEVEELALAWSEAWSEQRARTYLGFYAPDFRPPDALSRVDWEALREERILKPRSIRVEVRDLETEILSPERARVRFAQTYSSDRFRDSVRKTLELVRGEQGWQILEERTETRPAT